MEPTEVWEIQFFLEHAASKPSSIQQGDERIPRVAQDELEGDAGMSNTIYPTCNVLPLSASGTPISRGGIDAIFKLQLSGAPLATCQRCQSCAAVFHIFVSRKSSVVHRDCR